MSDPKELEDHVVVVREGHGANCSSIGSVIDTLFIAQIAAGAIVAAACAAIVAAKAETESESGSGTETGTASESGTETES